MRGERGRGSYGVSAYEMHSDLAQKLLFAPFGYRYRTVLVSSKHFPNPHLSGWIFMLASKKPKCADWGGMRVVSLLHMISTRLYRLSRRAL
jgi:hypothetical protein